MYPPRVLSSHFRLATNAYDLSVFDYALWSTLQGRLGDVPFIGHALFSHHFMPTLLALLPLYAWWQSPVFLIAVQLCAVVAAAVLLHRLLAPRVSPLIAGALLTAFLFSRRTHSAATSVFYIESLEPALVFGLLLAWQARRWRWYAALLLLALGCKEDMAIYLAAFGAVLWWSGERRAGAITAVAASLWLVMAIGWAIPAMRAIDGLSKENPFAGARYGATAGQITSGDVAARLASTRSLERVGVLVASTGLFALGAPRWMLVLAPGVALNLAARTDTGQSGLIGHYLWPILPWLFWAAALGAQRFERTYSGVSRWLSIALLVVTILDSPLWVGLLRGFDVSAAEASQLRARLRALPENAAIAASPNLLPHIEQRQHIWTIGGSPAPVSPDYVVLTRRGNLWPFSAAEITGIIECLDSDASFVRLDDEPAIFMKRAPTGELPACARTAPRP